MEYEVYNLAPPSGPYEGRLMSFWKSIFAFDTGVYNWKVKKTYTMMPQMWSFYPHGTIWYDGATRGVSQIAAGISVTPTVTGRVYSFSTAKLITTLVNSVVLLRVAQAIVGQ